MSEEVFCRKIVLFYLLNVVKFFETGVDKSADQKIEKIIGLYEQLKARKIDYYELLGLKNTAPFNEIKEAYFNYAKKYHPDRISAAPDPEIKEKSNFVFAEMNKAYDILINEDNELKIIDSGNSSYLDRKQDSDIEFVHSLFKNYFFQKKSSNLEI